MFKLLRVEGDSLDPVIREGDFVLVAKIPFFLNTLSKGDIIVFKHPDYGTLIKLVAGVEDNRREIIVKGMHENSIDSLRIGSINRDALIGKVLYHFQKNVNQVK